MSHAGRVLRPLEIHIPLKAGTKFSAKVDLDADGGEGMILVDIDRVWDFSVRLSIEDYGTLGKLIEELTKAQDAELGRIKNTSKVREPTTPDPSIPEKSSVARRRRRKKK